MCLSTYRQRLFGLTIESPFPLPAAPRVTVSSDVPDITISWEPEPAWNAALWRTIIAPSTPAYPEVLEAPDGGIALNWNGELRFVISPSGDRVRVISRPAKLEFAPTVLVGFVLGYLLSLRRFVCLHGAVLGRDGRAIAITGESGAGKSTIAAALIQRGARLLSDDLVVITTRSEKELFVEPACAGLRLTSTTVAKLLGSDSRLTTVPYLNKQLWDVSGQVERPDDRFCSQALPLDVLYVLEKPNGDDGTCEDVSIGSLLPPVAALRQLVAAWYPPAHLRLMTQDCLHALQQVATTLPVRVIRYAKRWEQLPRLVEMLSA